MLFKFKAVPLFDHHQIDDLLKQETEFWNKQKEGNIEQVFFDFSEAATLTVSNILFIKRILYLLRGSGIRCTAEYGKDTEHKKFIRGILETMGLLKPRMKSADIETYLDSFRVPVQTCMNGNESLTAVNKKLMPIIKKECGSNDAIFKAVNWILWEIVDNAGNHGYRTFTFEHNYPKPVFFCAYAYEDFIDVSVLDMGQGMQASFLNSGKEKYRNITNEQALRLSIQDKESGNPTGSPGFGLYGCSEIVRQSKGRLIIISGTNRLIQEGQDFHMFSCYNLTGTLVSIRIPAKFALDLKGIFSENSLIITEDIDSLFGDFNEEK